MDIITLFDIRARRSNGFSIFHNMSSLRNVRHCDLVTVGNIPMDADFFLLPLFIPNLYHCAVCDIIGKNGGYIVQVVYL